VVSAAREYTETSAINAQKTNNKVTPPPHFLADFSPRVVAPPSGLLAPRPPEAQSQTVFLP
jgi:hypothetical protein